MEGTEGLAAVLKSAVNGSTARAGENAVLGHMRDLLHEKLTELSICFNKTSIILVCLKA